MSDYVDEPQHFPGPPMKMNVTVESMDTSGLYMDVVREMATRLLGERYPESALRKSVLAAVDAEVQRRLDAILAERVEELLSKPIQKRDAFDNPVGPATDLLDMVASAGSLFITEPVDEKGVPTKGNGWGGSAGVPRVERIVQKIVLANLQKEIETEAKKVREVLTARATQAVAELLTKVRT